MRDFGQLTRGVGDLDEDAVTSFLQDLVKANPSADEAQAAVAACQKGMEIVGGRFESGEYFVGDLIFAGEVLKEAINILKPVIGSAATGNLGRIVLGTVQNDLHDIGKNIFKNMAEAAGFEIHDLGIDQPAASFILKIKEVNPQIVGMSGVLTLSIDAMKKVVEAIDTANLRSGVQIIIGGNPVTEESCAFVGADAYTTNAAEGVRICKGWVS